jgi:hypothetical protein
VSSLLFSRYTLSDVRLVARNHATNVFMLHALGITHVVSVGECALIPPPHHMHGHAQGYMLSSPFHRPGPGAHYIPGKGPTGQGSLWFEEREGRIKVMDIKGVCDDGIDTLEPQLEPICDWIDQARAEGGQVLVHCRVGVSRSATVTVSVARSAGSSLVADSSKTLDRICHEAPRPPIGRCLSDCSLKEVVGLDPAEHAAVV